MDFESVSAPGGYGNQPYADRTEATGPPETLVEYDPYHPFMATDARSVMIVLHPNHHNFIPNPAFREGTDGWEKDGSPIDAASLNPDSWVGQSVAGPGLFRYRDTDVAGDPAFVYVGPTKDITDRDWNEPGRSSSEWTFSAYVKGNGRVRLSMTAYEGEENSRFKSPPLMRDIVSGDPSTLGYDKDVPFVKDSEGNVWSLKTPPFYERGDRMLEVDEDPANFGPKDVLPARLLASDGSIWEVSSNTAPYYTRWGVPPVQSNPGGADASAGKYLAGDDGSYWVLKDPLPSAPPPDPDLGDVIPFGWYYVKVSIPASESLVLDTSLFPTYLKFSADGTVWKVDTAATTAPFYTSLGTLQTISGDILEQEPGDPYVILGDTVWKLADPPWYEPSSASPNPYLERLYGPWTDIVEGQGWTRVLLQTSARVPDDQLVVSFAGCSWIDAVIETEGDLLVSAVMLDPTEYPVAQYFDGSMSEVEGEDDFLWADLDESYNQIPNQGESWYYYDRVERTQWLYDALTHLTPVGRPVQIFYGSYAHPYVSTSVRTSVSAEMNRHDLVL